MGHSYKHMGVSIYGHLQFLVATEFWDSKKQNRFINVETFTSLIYVLTDENDLVVKSVRPAVVVGRPIPACYYKNYYKNACSECVPVIPIVIPI